MRNILCTVTLALSPVSRPVCLDSITFKSSQSLYPNDSIKRPRRLITLGIYGRALIRDRAHVRDRALISLLTNN